VSEPLDFPGHLPPPPPSPALLAAVGAMKPVHTRVPARAALLLLASGVVFPVAALALRPLRADLPFLPTWWVVLVAALWAGAALLSLASAVIPRRGEVLPDAGRAGRAAAVVAGGLVLLGLLGGVEGPDRAIQPASFAGGLWHCLRFGLPVTLPMVLVAAVLLRRLHPLGGRRIGAAVGAAGGALAGLTLHFVCPFASGAHVGLAHGGGVVLGAVLGALLLGAAARSGA
jgi:hypothetical protein